eukprot:997221-Pleurochrysis_carterae.AAC.1
MHTIARRSSSAALASKCKLELSRAFVPSTSETVECKDMRFSQDDRARQRGALGQSDLSQRPRACGSD